MPPDPPHRAINTPAEYLSRYRELQRDWGGLDETRYKIAILPSFTPGPLAEILTVKLHQLGIPSDIYVSPHNQHITSILDDNSDLYRFSPQLVVVFFDTRSICGDWYFTPFQSGPPDLAGHMLAQEETLLALIERLKQGTSATILLHNLEVPTHSPVGILDSKQAFGLAEVVESLNANLRQHFRQDERVFLFSYDRLCSLIGKEQLCQAKMVYLADMRLDWHHLPRLCEEYLAHIRPLLGMSRKCLVLDLDNVLWGGIVGEVGIEGIQLAPHGEGRAYWELQKHILALYQRGVILAVNSKNNPDDALRIMREHPHTILNETHFASLQINWNDKADNLRTIAKELNIGLDSLVFMDDDPFNRDLVRAVLPGVQVVELPDDAALYSQTLLALPDFNTRFLTEEDQNRGRLYAEDRARQRLRQTAPDLDTFLRDLGIQVTLHQGSACNLVRTAQLVQKTNQFNLTTRRHTLETITDFVQSPQHLVVSLSVRDRQGDYGITGVIIVEKQASLWRIDTLLLSCRIIGRRVEEAVWGWLLQAARQAGVPCVQGEFIETAKNQPARDFYERMGFSSMEKRDALEIWRFDTAQPFHPPAFIEVNSDYAIP